MSLLGIFCVLFIDHYVWLELSVNHFCFTVCIKFFLLVLNSGECANSGISFWPPSPFIVASSLYTSRAPRAINAARRPWTQKRAVAVWTAMGFRVSSAGPALGTDTEKMSGKLCSIRSEQRSADPMAEVILMWTPILIIFTWAASSGMEVPPLSGHL